MESSHELRDSYTSFFLVPVLILDLFWNPKPGQGEGVTGRNPGPIQVCFTRFLTTSRRGVEQNPTLLMIKTLITTVASVEFLDGAEQFVRLKQCIADRHLDTHQQPIAVTGHPHRGPLRHNFKRGA